MVLDLLSGLRPLVGDGRGGAAELDGDGCRPAAAAAELGALDRRRGGVAQHLQMLGHRRLAYPKLCGDRVHDCTSRMLPGGQELQDPTPDGITQDVQRVHADNLSIKTYIGQELLLLDDRRFPVLAHGAVADLDENWVNPPSARDP